MTTYIIETWDPKTKKYQKLWEHYNYQRAEIQMNKSYNRRHTNRLIRKDYEILYVLHKDKRK